MTLELALSRLFLAVALACCFVGCSSFQKQSLLTIPAAEDELYALKVWRLEGRVGVQTAKNAWHANLFWDHEADQDRLRISGPLSQGLLSIIVQKDLIYVSDGSGKGEMSRDPVALLERRLGFAVPLSSLRYWVLGVPDPVETFVTEVADANSSRRFLQKGWLLDVERLVKVGRFSVPQKVLIQGGGVKLKLIADYWEIKG